MPQLRIEAEYGYDGEINYHVIEFDDEHEEEVVAVVYGREDIAEALVNAVQAFEVLGKM
jgi:hypothetical protein